MVEQNRNEAHNDDASLNTMRQEFFAKIRPGEKLGRYIQGVLLNRQWTLEDLAEKLGHETPLFLQALVTGNLSEESIDEQFIEDLARIIDRSPNVIRVILGRKPKEGTRLDSLLTEQTEHNAEMIATLLEVLPERYEPDINDDFHKSKQYDFVIKQLEKFIARQKRELEAAKKLVKQLQEYAPDESMKLDLQRIIYHIITNDPEAEVRESEVLLSRPRTPKHPKR